VDGGNGVNRERYGAGVLMERSSDLFRPERTGQGQPGNDSRRDDGRGRRKRRTAIWRVLGRVWLSGGVVLTLLCGGISQTVRRGFGVKRERILP